MLDTNIRVGPSKDKPRIGGLVEAWMPLKLLPIWALARDNAMVYLPLAAYPGSQLWRLNQVLGPVIRSRCGSSGRSVRRWGVNFLHSSTFQKRIGLRAVGERRRLRPACKGNQTILHTRRRANVSRAACSGRDAFRDVKGCQRESDHVMST